MVTAEQPGSAALTARLFNRSAEASAQVLLPGPDDPSPGLLEVRAPSLSVEQEQALQLQAFLVSDQGETEVTDTVSWSSGSDTIATVSPEGFVIGVLPGTVAVTATDSQSGQSAGVSLEVLPFQDPSNWATGLLSSIDGTTPANGISQNASLSASGRYVAFDSDANNLTADSTGGFTNVYLLDRQTRQVDLISKPTSGGPPTADSYGVELSRNGRYLVFTSYQQLHELDTDQTEDVYLYDRLNPDAGFELVSISSDNATSANALAEVYSGVISEDGRFVLFDSDATDLAVAPTVSAFRQVYLAPNPLYVEP